MFELLNTEEICSQLIIDGKCSAPPIDLESISSLWPGLKISDDNLEKEGYLVYLGAQGGELILRRDDPPNRKRFTFAHELGHWVLSHYRGGDSFSYDSGPAIRSVHASRYTPEENWCNDFAGKLLVPTEHTRDYLAGLSVDIPGKLISGALLFQVSEDTFLARITELFGWVVVFLNHGRDLHRVGKRFMRRDEDRKLVDELVGEVLRQTDSESLFIFDEIALPGFTAYGTIKSTTRNTSTYLICLMPSSVGGKISRFVT